MSHKLCPWCKTKKPIDEFGIIRDGGKGTAPTRRRTRCRSCQHLANRCVVLAPRHFGYESRSEELRALPRTAVNDMHKKFQDLLRKDYGGFTKNAIDAYLADRDKAKGKIEIPQEEIESDAFMQILVTHERKKNPNRQVRRDQLPYGYVYGVWHPADYWKGWVKAGRSGIMRERLSSYQTSDPWKNFKPLHKVLVTDRYAGEKLVLDYFRDAEYEVLDEWVRVDHDTFIDVLNWLRDDNEFSADEILDEYRTWMEQRAA